MNPALPTVYAAASYMKTIGILVQMSRTTCNKLIYCSFATKKRIVFGTGWNCSLHSRGSQRWCHSPKILSRRLCSLFRWQKRPWNHLVRTVHKLLLLLNNISHLFFYWFTCLSCLCSIKLGLAKPWQSAIYHESDRGDESTHLLWSGPKRALPRYRYSAVTILSRYVTF